MIFTIFVAIKFIKMRRNIIITLLFCSLALSATAQDILAKKNGDKLKVKVLEVSETRIKYLRHNTESPIYTLPLADIDYIEYTDGSRDTFNSTPAPTPAVAPATAAVTDVLYEIGSFYDRDGIQGIVIATTEGGKHGTIISLDEACLPWSTIDRKQLKSCGCDDSHDGRNNMAALERFIAAEGLSWSDFPAAEWCRSKGEGWYLPAIIEVWQLGTIVNGGSRTAPRRDVRKQYNKLLKDCGGKAINGIMYYHASTEASNPKYSTFSHCSPDEPHTGEGAKSDKLFVRAYYRF